MIERRCHPRSTLTERSIELLALRILHILIHIVKEELIILSDGSDLPILIQIGIFFLHLLKSIEPRGEVFVDEERFQHLINHQIHTIVHV